MPCRRHDRREALWLSHWPDPARLQLLEGALLTKLRAAGNELINQEITVVRYQYGSSDPTDR